MSINLIKQLRAASGAPMTDCKKAVAATASLDEAFEWLRKKGLSRAAKMADRVAEQGLVALQLNASRTLGCLVEVRSETDFVARNELFQAFSRSVAAAALQAAERGDGLDVLGQLPVDGGTAEAAAVALSATVGEKVSVHRAAVVGAPDCLVAGYAHNAYSSGLGTHAALVAVRNLTQAPFVDGAADVAKRVAMHVVAATPTYLDPTCVPQAVLDAETEVLRAQVADMGKKPEHIVAKIMQAKLDKFVAEKCLTTQISVVEEGKRSIATVLEADAGLEVAAFARILAGKDD